MSGVSSEDDKLVNVILQSWRRSSSFIALSRLQIWQTANTLYYLPTGLSRLKTEQKANINTVMLDYSILHLTDCTGKTHTHKN